MDESTAPLSDAARRARRRLDAAFASYALLCLLALTWPGLAALSRWAPLLTFGLPTALAWTTGWVVLTFVLFSLYHRVRP